MPNKKNKVKVNICNVHYAVQHTSENGEISYEKPKPMPGAVSIGLDANGEPSNFYAVGYAYYTISNNMGYDGDLELALIPEDFRTEILKEEKDNNGVLIENSKVEAVNFALLFEFDGDVHKIRHVMYNCSASRPSIESKTNEEEAEVQVEKITIKAKPLPNGCVKAKTGDSTNDAVYLNWYNEVYMPNTIVGGQEMLAAVM